MKYRIYSFKLFYKMKQMVGSFTSLVIEIGVWIRNTATNLQARLREVVDPLVLHGAHGEFKDYNIGISTSNGLPGASDQRLETLLLDIR